ncbi:PHP domain-containing protein [Dictyobacter kobayashii]|uniref:PHP-like protein n=1 Tax=Dictyobacter kobayashii TaxID=2014872 RepID=A0A402AID0_9CHLR|nr:PHP domain-containing protein [Dictyobacter kobayashii]GCE18825.1 PHP-like protein [Dictyobacter kobayashii]
MARLTTTVTLRPDSAVDFHMHTTYSDGRWPAQQVIDFLAKEKFDLIAVTDHDRVDKVAEIQALGAAQSLPVLSGVEMSTEWNGSVGNGRMGDMLCYGFDPEQNELSSLTERVVRRQLENTYEVNEKLRSMGYDFPRQEELLAANGGKLRFPADNAMLLREHGHVPSWHAGIQKMKEAGFYSVRSDMAETVEAVHRSGGVCVIAHPGRRENGFTFYDIALLDQLRAEIPIDGIEMYHPYHSQDMVKAYIEYVEKHDLLGTTGSDSHFISGRMPIKHRAEISRRFLERVGVHVE